MALAIGGVVAGGVRTFDGAGVLRTFSSCGTRRWS